MAEPAAGQVIMGDVVEANRKLTRVRRMLEAERRMTRELERKLTDLTERNRIAEGLLKKYGTRINKLYDELQRQVDANLKLSKGKVRLERETDKAIAARNAACIVTLAVTAWAIRATIGWMGLW